MNMVPIGEIVDFIGGGTPSRDFNDYWNGDIPWASVKDFKGSLIDSTLESITLDGLSNSSSTLIPAGYVIMPTRMALGKAAINSIDVAINQDLKALKPKREVDTRYLLHAVLSKAKEIQSHGKGATVQGITIERLSAIQIPLPPLEEQRRIAAILDKSHSIQGLLLQRHRMLQALINSMLISDFGSPTEWPLKWKMQKLGDCCECLDRYRRPVKESERQEGHIPYYGANGQQGWIDDFLFDESLVLVAEDGGHFADRMRGVAYRIDGKAWVNNHAHILRPRGNDLEIEFLHRILRHYDFVPYISGSTRSKLTQGQLNEVPIPVPPIDRQRSFSRCVERLVSSLGTSSRSLKAAESLSRSLAQSILESEK